MCVASRNGNGHTGDACAYFVNRTGIGAASTGLAKLIGNVKFFCCLGKKTDQARIRDRAGISNINCRASIQTAVIDRILFTIFFGQVKCLCGIDGDG